MSSDLIPEQSWKQWRAGTVSLADFARRKLLSTLWLFLWILFCVLDTTGTVLVLPPTDDRFASRSLTLRRDAYVPKGEMEEFVNFSFR